MTTHTPTGLVWDDRYLEHNPGGGAGPLAESTGLIEPGDFGEEGPYPRRRLYNLILKAGLDARLAPIEPRPASDVELTRVHTSGYIARIRELSAQGGGDAGGGTPFGANGNEIARLAAGGCLSAVDRVLGGSLRNAYALVKPPGHHAMPDSGGGHCIFNNAALAAAHARTAHALQRVSIVDWDVHWGNGTQAAFWTDPNVQVIGLHQADWYPRGGGEASATGGGPGLGANINVPLPPGSGAGAYRAAFDRIVLPALAAHRPELIIVSCGFDASANDPSGRMLLTSEDFRLMTRWVMSSAAEHSQNRLIVCHEGGYSPTYVPFCGLAVLEELSGSRPIVEDPFLPRYSGVGYEQLQPHQAAGIDEIITLRHNTLRLAGS